ncbi:MAG: YdcF family protein [Neisseriaceae bacterium]|nr:YdcF family protein [Neisseriaceae bacterium]
MTLKKWLSLGLIGMVLAVVLSFSADHYVTRSSQARLYDQASDVPHQPTALVLGTSPYLRSGQPNPYFLYRIKAAATLYHAQKVDNLVVSGDNRREAYNEPEDMKQALMAQGVPEARIYLDYAGLRTLDSVVRMDKIFGQKSFVIVSQPFHNARAVFIAQQKGLNAYGYNAVDVRLNAFTLRTFVREKLARVKVLLDVWLNKQPRHLGPAVLIHPSSAPSAPSSTNSPT